MVDREDPDQEQQPLLSSETATLLDYSADDESRQQTGSYPGSEEFDHLPWQKRPSVSHAFDSLCRSPDICAGLMNPPWQVLWLVGPFLIFTLAFGGVLIPKLNL